MIRALNQDMPFTRFTIEQIAGDLLPERDAGAQFIASGMHANTTLNQEDGVDADEVRWEALTDRVDTTATVWLGATSRARVATITSTTPSPRRTTTGSWPSSITPTCTSTISRASPIQRAGGRPGHDLGAHRSSRRGPRPPTSAIRGTFSRKGEQVSAGPPALHPMRKGSPMNRLGLAYWLVDDANPLTARVVVNRLLGRALLGARARRDRGGPRHPGPAPVPSELLDWLATEFVRGRGA